MHSNVNWSPELLNKSITYHDLYSNVFSGYSSDLKNLSNCPQYILEFTNPSTETVPVHVMISRHYTDYDEMLGCEKTKIVMSLQAYAIKKPAFLTKESETIQTIRDEAVFTNIPYDVCHIHVPPGNSTYSVVIMTYKREENNRKKFNFSLQMRYPKIIEGTMRPIQHFPNYRFITRECGQWTDQNNGGPITEKTFLNNPWYTFQITAPTYIHAFLESIQNSNAVLSLYLLRYEHVSAGEYRREYRIAQSSHSSRAACMLEQELEPGTYTLIPAEDHKLVNLKYNISIRSSKPLLLNGEHCLILPTPGFEEFIRYCITKTIGQSQNCGLGIRGFADMD